MAVGVTHISLKKKQGSLVFGRWEFGSRSSSSPGMARPNGGGQRRIPDLENNGVRPSDSPAAHALRSKSGVNVLLSLGIYSLKMQCLPDSSLGPKNREEAPRNPRKPKVACSLGVSVS